LKSGFREFNIEMQGDWAPIDQIVTAMKQDRADLDVRDNAALTGILQSYDDVGRFELKDGWMRKLARDQRMHGSHQYANNTHAENSQESNVYAKPNARPWSRNGAKPWIRPSPWTRVKQEVKEEYNAHNTSYDKTKPAPPPGLHWKRYVDSGTLWWYYEGPLGKWWAVPEHADQIITSAIIKEFEQEE